MPWLEIRIDTSEQLVGEYEVALETVGALSVTYTDAGDQPILEPEAGTMPLWSDIVVVGLFDGSIDTADVETSIRKVNSSANLRWDILEDRVWEREWLKHHNPQQFGKALWVYHETVEDDLPTLLLDPGLAFGTGTHPTTALCLEWITQQTMTNKAVVDFGCGSGILAIAAIMRGSQSATCIDVDAQALLATRNNAERNQIPEDKLSVYFPGNEPDSLCDLLIANILAKPLMQLADNFAAKVATGGNLCLSGILREQETGIIDQYKLWFDQIKTDYRDDWACVTGVRNERVMKTDTSVFEKKAG